ncbi:uncharacterized protein LOC105840763 isoform X3 [Monomorium pharaonis]|uniref:uncharacterized protein LOC105840763 isoform X3 n=1 Tax=Monomorium pharaonis TaxID=307658 RepID=UPI001745F949|nr:uncharacterized protein LOC105840763 isoform X3 [Monomorium pharaonis]
MKIYIKIYKEVVKILIMFALVMLTNGTYYVCPLNDIYARKGNNCMLKNAQLRTKACIMAVNANIEHLSKIKKNLNHNIPRVKLQSINLCKYKTLSRQKPRIIKSEVLKKGQKIKIKNKSKTNQQAQEKLKTTSEEYNLSDMILTNDFSNAILQIDTVNNDSSSTDLCLNIQTRILEKSNTRETLDTLVERSKTNTDEDNYKILTNDFSNAALQTDTVNNDIWSTDLCFENIETRVLERSDNQETLNMSVEKSRTNTDEDNYMILTNDFSKSTLQIGTMKNNSSSTDLCVEDTETIILEKSDTQETLNMLVEKSRKNTDGDNSSEYIPSSTSESSIYSDTENDNTKNNRKNVSVNKTNTSSGLDISNLHLSGTKMCDDAEMYVTESSGKQTHSKKIVVITAKSYKVR